MERAKLLRNGNSQAVRLPKEFRIPGNEIKICKKGKQIIIAFISSLLPPASQPQ
jgi:antitoxin VapB